MTWKSWKYKNLTLLLLTFCLSVFLGGFHPFQNFLFATGVPAAFAAGVIFVSTFSAPIAAATLLVLAEHHSILELWLAASVGALLSDLLFFSVFKDNLGKEIEPIYESLAGNHFHKVIHTRHFRWLFPVLGAFIILSPLPKAPGLHMLGIPKLKTEEFILLSAGVNIVGIAFILFLSIFIKP